MRRLYVIAFVAVVFSSGCGRGIKNNAEVSEQDAKIESTTLKQIKRPSIPAVVSSPAEATAYYVEHFWDHFDFTDTAYVDKPEITEQALADYIMGLGVAAPADASASINKMMSKAMVCPAMFDYFVEIYEKYLYDPNSPARNEDLYIMVLNSILDSPEVDELEKLRPRSQLEMAMKNRVGETANDFTLTMDAGNRIRLSAVDAEYTLLYINNPDCSACAEVTQEIRMSELAQTMIGSGVMKVVAVYPDKELDVWRKHLDDLPSDWIRGYDAGQVIRNNRLYDLKAIPTLYLLDRDKKVLVKDAARFAQIETYLRKGDSNN